MDGDVGRDRMTWTVDRKPFGSHVQCLLLSVGEGQRTNKEYLALCS